ncbi:hypothetical protein CTI12_AA021570 [Artemisia annua]|uniref:Uncharacterized protein n=1 Tax=Artemisia annua TaxID=35608 RepID=A0A2U1QJW6_ARTAN|nr:hypothetical protein CTI12_AA021570 [Artemisia annua]
MTIRSKKLQQSQHFKTYLKAPQSHSQFSVTPTTDIPHQEQTTCGGKIVVPESFPQVHASHLDYTLQRPPDSFSAELLTKEKGKGWTQTTDILTKPDNKTNEGPFKNDLLWQQYASTYDRKHQIQTQNVYPYYDIKGKGILTEDYLTDAYAPQPSQVVDIHDYLSNNILLDINTGNLNYEKQINQMIPGPSCLTATAETTESKDNSFATQNCESRQKNKRSCKRKSGPTLSVHNRRISKSMKHCATTSHTEDVSSLYINLGDADWNCQYCNARFWYGERLKGNGSQRSPKYNRCCRGGQIHFQREFDPP